jgi:7-cyano-7-deazaguanine reductase
MRGYREESQEQPTPRIPGRYGLDEIAANTLEAWPNSHPEREYIVHFEIPEFTCLCPRSGFPDFATVTIDYAPAQQVVELKSLKLYINGFRNRQISHETAANLILDELFTLLKPRWMRVVADFTVRGNIKTIGDPAHPIDAIRQAKGNVRLNPSASQGQLPS